MSLSVTPQTHSSLSPKIFYFLSFLVVPVFIIGLIDVNFLQSSLSNFLNLSQAPSLYVPLLAFPHILSSLIILFSNSDKAEVRNTVFTKVLPVAIMGIGCFFISKILFDIIFLILLTQHIAGQTTGIIQLSLPETSRSDKMIKFWKWINYPALAVAFIMVYTVHLKLFLNSSLDMMINISSVVIALASIFTLFYFKTNKKLFILAQVYYIGVFYFAIKSSLFYWGIVFILGHDVVAFLIYQNYYTNRLGSHGKALGASFIVPAILSFSLVFLSLSLGTPYLVFFFQFAHYFAERFCWKGSSPLRALVSIK